MIRFVFLLTALVGILGYSLVAVDEKAQAVEQQISQSDAREVLYLPDGTGLELLSFGYKNVLSNYLWFKTVSYFGKHYRSDRNFQWLQHMCNLITDLNPYAEHVFTFCGTMLAWEVEAPQAAYDIYTKAIESSPEQWNYYYLRGFTSMYFLEDSISAERDLQKASEFPDVPAFVVRLAASKMLLSDPRQAQVFLSEMIRETRDEHQRAALIDKLKEVTLEVQFQEIERRIEFFAEQQGRPPSGIDELQEYGLISNQREVTDPYGGRFYIDQESGEVRTTSKKKRKKKDERTQ
ncbi:hypothetical protein MRY87_10165 [bacterium]|nr:hypothetical protein [bacterium]